MPFVMVGMWHLGSGIHRGNIPAVVPRRLGGISKRGDSYVRMLLIHGARAVLNRAKQLVKAGHRLSRLRRWALALESRAGHNKATVG